MSNLQTQFSNTTPDSNSKQKDAVEMIGLASRCLAVLYYILKGLTK